MGLGSTIKVAVFAVLVLGVRVAPGQQAPPPQQPSFADQLRGLDLKKDKARRLNALRWLGSNADRTNAALAFPALGRCASQDPDDEVRRRAVAELSHLANRLKRPCPLAVVEALLDPVDEVRWEAASWAGAFKAFAPGSVEVLLSGAQAEKPDVRSTSLLLLARAGGTDAKALEAMQKATRDRVFEVRHCAHLALFYARNKLEEHLPYLIRLREDPDAVLSPCPEGSPLRKEELQERNLVLIGTATQLLEWSDTRADELAAVLVKLLADKSAVMRRGAANVIGATAVKVELAPEGSPLAGPALFRPFLAPSADGKPPREDEASPRSPFPNPVSAVPGGKAREARREKSKVALRLETLKVPEALCRLRDNDPDASVRDAARRALERLSGAEGKEP